MPEPATKDKQVVALSPKGREHLERLVDTGYFRELQDAYRLAVAVALIKSLPPASSSRRTTFVSVGGLDPDGSLSMAVQQLHSGIERIYAFIEDLGEAGLADIAEHLQQGRHLDSYLTDLELELDLGS